MHEIDRTIVDVAVDSLRESPQNKEIHADFDPMGRDAWMVDDIRQHGILLPLLVRPDRTIKEGHRRHRIARHLKHGTVPCIILRSNDDGAAFKSAQLSRHMTLFAKCVLYRDQLVDMIRRGDDVRERNLKLRWDAATTAGAGGANADDSALNQEWIQCEEVLGVSRRFLLRGIKLLNTLEKMQASGAPEEIDRAARVLSIFRNRGVEPARRMLGEHSGAADDGEPDVIDWRNDDGDMDDAPAKSKGGKKAAGVVKFAKKKGEEPPEPWIAETLKCLGRIETLAKKHNVYGPVVEASLNAIENEINGGSAKRAA